MPLVLDASVTVNWAFPQSSPYADHVLGLLAHDDAFVPSIWPAEVANGIVVGERRGHLDTTQRAEFMRLLHKLDVIIEATAAERTFSLILDLAGTQGLTVYDATYLELALRDGVPLATEDAALRAAAIRVGVAVVNRPDLSV